MTATAIPAVGDALVALAQTGAGGAPEQGPLVRVAARIVGLTLLAGILGAAIGTVHRWYARQRVPEGLAILVGLSGVALFLNTTPVLGAVIVGDTGFLDIESAVFNVTTFALAAGAGSLGGRTGDRLGEAIFGLTGGRTIGGEVSGIVRSVGRVTPVELPEEIGDVEGYDPVDPEIKEKFAGETFIFPRRLTVEELRTRLIDRLRTDYDVGYVDIDLSDQGTVEYLAVGSRVSGLGPTLPPETAAVAVRADPAFAASAGDVVQLWRTDPDGTPERVAGAEVRGVAGDVVTVSVDAADAEKLDPSQRYRVVTLPVEPRSDREFASLLRAADETMGVVQVRADSSLVGTPVGALDVSVVAVRPAGGGSVEAIPSRSRPLAVGETLYAIARPDRLRKLEAAARESAGTVAP